MQEKYVSRQPDMKYMCMDACEIDFPDNSFTAAIDKGTLDALLCEEGSTGNGQKSIAEAYRVLGYTGVYIIISNGSPENRLPLLQKEEFEWDVTNSEILTPEAVGQGKAITADTDKSLMHFVYVCKKRVEPPAEEES